MSPHRFHIPVMGTGFTIDTPLHVAQWGVSSVISIVDDQLIEQMRGYHARKNGRAFEPILDGADEPGDARARRITAYLDLLHELVHAQIERIRASAFEPGSPIEHYFSMLPDGPLREAYLTAERIEDPEECRRARDELREQVVPGSIDANIMTKIDRRTGPKGELRAPEDSDALAALRGFARSRGDGAMVFSAGLNPRLYAYAAELGCFAPDAEGRLRKRIILKVSDYRSAAIQGRYLAKRGLWVSEYRIESGLNCGGHAFATAGLLMGPILEQFSRQKHELIDKLFGDYENALASAGLPVPASAPPVQLTCQGGIGTAEEDALLRDRYGADATGWGSPFLLVRGVTRVDAQTRARLAQARRLDVQRGSTSPLGVPFWSLITSASDVARRGRLERTRPGSICPKGYLALEEPKDGPPLCPASRAFVRRASRAGQPRGPDKACICHDLGGGALVELGIDEDMTPAVCPGPNIANFSDTTSLEQMIDHIYGRASLRVAADRDHVFIAELELYLEEFERLQLELPDSPAPRLVKELDRFHQNLVAAIEHYWARITWLPMEQRADYAARLDQASLRLEGLGTSTPRKASA